MRWLRLLFYLTILTGFIGPILAFSAVPQLFGFKIFFFLHGGALFVYCLIKRRLAIRISIKGYLIFFAVWLIWGGLSLFWADSSRDGLRQLSFLLGMDSMILFYLFYLQEERELVSMEKIFLLVLSGLTVLGVAETLTGRHLSTSAVNTYTQAYKIGIPSAVFWNPNDFASYLSLYLPFALVMMKYGRGLLEKSAAVFLYCTGFYLMIATESRANFLALLCGLFSFIKLNFTSEQKKLAKILLITFLVMSLLFSFLVYFQPKQPFILRAKRVLTQIYQLPEQLGQNKGSAYVRSRLIIYGLKELSNHYFFGVGAGNAETHLATYSEKLGGVLNLHNWWAEILVNYGVFIFLGYLLFYLGLVKELTGICRRGSLTSRRLAESLVISLTSFPLACIGPSVLIHQRYLWFLFAFALAVLNYNRQTERLSKDSKGEFNDEDSNSFPSLSKQCQSDGRDFCSPTGGGTC